MKDNTTFVNTGSRTCVVKCLKNEWGARGLQEFHYSGCRLHILDGVFCLVYEEVFDIKTTGPDMDECIVKRIQNKFQDLKILFSDGEEIPEEEECFIRDDYKYLEMLVGGVLSSNRHASKNSNSEASFHLSFNVEL